MRELRFRVWEEREKAYDTWSYILDMSGNLFRNAYGALIGCDKKDYIVEQFTGLYDKDGKKIYEGDLLKWNDCVLQVIWENDCACFELAYLDGKIEEGMCVREYAKNYKVLGDIHENKELLNEYRISKKTTTRSI